MTKDEGVVSIELSITGFSPLSPTGDLTGALVALPRQRFDCEISLMGRLVYRCPRPVTSHLFSPQRFLREPAKSRTNTSTLRGHSAFPVSLIKTPPGFIGNSLYAVFFIPVALTKRLIFSILTHSRLSGMDLENREDDMKINPLLVCATGNALRAWDWLAELAKKMGPRRAVSVLALMVFILPGGLLCSGYYLGKRATQNEWSDKTPGTRRLQSETRGLMEGMVKYREVGAPSFVPQSAWDDAVCAANIINAVNFLVGEPLLNMSPAWLFSKVNADGVNLVYDRHTDFEVKEGRLIEKYDRGFSLTKILRGVNQDKSRPLMDRIYVIGYRYTGTRVDSDMLEEGWDWNSHLMLLLGKVDGTWWGYHMFHDPRFAADQSPFRIDDLGETMPVAFDLLYIWEVRNTVLDNSSAKVLAYGPQRPYVDLLPYLNYFPWSERLEYFIDTALVYYFGDAEQFPRVLNLEGGVVPVGYAKDTNWRGQVLGFYQGVPVRRHVDESRRGNYGLEFQCVEFVNRYLVSLGHRNLTRTGNADSYFYDARAKGLIPMANGSTSHPEVGDVVVFDPDGVGKDPGHVAVVSEVASDKVCIVQQNSPEWVRCLRLESAAGRWRVQPLNPNLPCVGWVRRRMP